MIKKILFFVLFILAIILFVNKVTNRTVKLQKIQIKKASNLPYKRNIPLNSYFTYRNNNQGIFQHGYYFPNLGGAIETIGYGVSNVLIIDEGEYKLNRTACIKGSYNVIMGDKRSKPHLIVKAITCIEVSGDSNLISNLYIINQ